MVLTIDIGNTKTKVAVFDGEQLLKHVVIEYFNKNDIDVLVSQFKSFESVIISSVSVDEECRIAQLLEENGIKYCLLSYKLQLPFEIDYLTPETLGKDRIAALAGAYAVGGVGNYLVIDCGTCNTYDLLVDEHFVGGNIAPGLQMRLDAMHYFTAALPQCSIENVQLKMHNAQLGLTTHEAILNGAYWGVVHEINGYIEKYSEEYNDLKVILTGGLFAILNAQCSTNGLKLKQKMLKAQFDIIHNISNTSLPVVYEPMLVPKGLNFIAKNIQNK
ncbi:MAG: type III pantothenate kinase [Paludibacteraceae bacterium]|nr:type III pantothenate kinase [Paludibacteraceae bacterium]